MSRMNIPNTITAMRLVLLVPMFVAFFYDAWFAFAVLLVVLYATDMLDGFLARRLHQTSEFGLWFDSLAANVAIICIML